MVSKWENNITAIGKAVEDNHLTTAVDLIAIRCEWLSAEAMSGLTPNPSCSADWKRAQRILKKCAKSLEEVIG